MDKKKVYKALMVEDFVHQKVVVKAKQDQLTVSVFISNLFDFYVKNHRTKLEAPTSDRVEI